MYKLTVVGKSNLWIMDINILIRFTEDKGTRTITEDQFKKSADLRRAYEKGLVKIEKIDSDHAYFQ